MVPSNSVLATLFFTWRAFASETIIFISYLDYVGSSLTIVFSSSHVAVTVFTDVVVYIPTYVAMNRAVVVRLPTTADQGEREVSNSLIIGGVSGVAAVVVLIIGAIIFVVRRKHSEGDSSLSLGESAVTTRLAPDADPELLIIDDEALVVEEATNRFDSDDTALAESLDPSAGPVSGMWI
jgi:hypothetical protein